MKLHLGVVDLPYVQQQLVSERTDQPKGGQMTTAGVARILEDKYEVMGHFTELHAPEIAEVLIISLEETIDALAVGAPTTIDPFGQAVQDIEAMFRTYLRDEEIAQTGQEGVPTAAAENGVNHRLKKRKGTRRPSFIDTGLYQSSMKVWVE